MTSASLKLYKLIILYFLNKTNQPMSNAIISDFILDNGYTDYFSIQQTLTSLTADKMITAEQTYSACYYTITSTGQEMLELFITKLPDDTKFQIDNYMKDNMERILEETTIHIDFTQINQNEYLAKGSVIERGSVIMEMSLSVPTEENAAKACKRFKEKSAEIYSFLVKTLLN